jgi:FkbM family methyltransferase
VSAERSDEGAADTRSAALYGQTAEVDLCAAFLSRLEHRSVIDVGAERGAYVEEMLRAGSERIFAIEPEPRNIAFLKQRFLRDKRVTVHACAASEADGVLHLHLSEGPDGVSVPFGHTTLERPNTDEIAWRTTITVRARSLASLAERGEISKRAGILKIDTEGHDLAVVTGMGATLDCDVVMVEHWRDLPHSLGPCPWTADQMIRALNQHGFSHFVFIAHHGELTTLQWDDACVSPGQVGNLVFLHDRVLAQLLPDVIECAASLAQDAVRIAQERTMAADERLVVIEELTRARDQLESEGSRRLAAIEEVNHERDLLARTAAERLAAMEELTAEIAETTRSRNEGAHSAPARRALTGLRTIGVRTLRSMARSSRAGSYRGLRAPARVRSWTKPRIGNLRHYEPKRLEVPVRYFRTAPPDPAPSISIVTPSYEQGRFLERTLYSVLSQNYPGLEYIVQDGASSDGTVEVLHRFDYALTRWSSEQDDGQADAINRGFRSTTGEIMAWLNSDDLLLPGSLAYVARYFVEHPDVDVVYGHRLMIDDDDNQIGAWIVPRHDDLALTLADYIPQETLFWRRRIWEAVGGALDPTFAYALDWDLLLRFREAGARIVRLPRFIGAFRIHGAQKTTTTHAVGEAECDRLRRRVHGRPVSHEEVLQRLKPYLLRHILAHTRQRVVDRLPVRRLPVRTMPRSDLEPEVPSIRAGA